MANVLNYTPEEKKYVWKILDYSFCLPETIEQLLEIDNVLQISVNQARMDLILSKQIIPVYVKKEADYKIMILLKKTEDCLLLDFFCGVQKSVPSQEEMNIIKKWCEEKQIILSYGVRL